MTSRSALNQVLDTFTPEHAVRVRAMREYCLIEGTAGSLRFLASLLRAVADSNDCDFRFSPFETGFGLLTDDSTRGVWIHRLPCDDGPMDLRRPRYRATGPVAPAKFDDIHRRVLTHWPDSLDLSDGYLIKETNGYYSRTLGEAWSDAEDRVDPTNEWDTLMVWTLYGCVHRAAKRACESGGTTVLRPADLPEAGVRAAYLEDLSGEGYEDLRAAFMAANPESAS